MLKFAYSILVLCLVASLEETAANSEPIDLLKSDIFSARSGYHYGNNERQIYYPQQAQSESGTWTLTANKVPAVACQFLSSIIGQCDYQSGWIDTYHPNPDNGWVIPQYSRGTIIFEASITTPANNAKGMWPAIWLLPKSLGPALNNSISLYPWPLNGEIDVLEIRGSQKHHLSNAVHYGADGDSGHAYKGVALTSQQFDRSEPNQYGFSWDFTKTGPLGSNATLSWYLRTPSGSWQHLNSIDLSQLADNRQEILCPRLSWRFPALNQLSKECYRNQFIAGMESGYYLIINLAVGGVYDGDPVQDLSGSKMHIHSGLYYPDLDSPNSLN